MTKLRHRSIVIIGGGFYGCSIAEHLATQGAAVTLIEREPDLMMRASYNNQARLHGGYHYPRSFGTGYRSRLNFQRFLNDYRPAIATEFTKLYAIARIGSKVSPHQFEIFCRNIEAPIQPASPRLARLFSSRLIAKVYETQEYAFDASILRQMLSERLSKAGVQLKLSTNVVAIEARENHRNHLLVIDSKAYGIAADYVFNCTYSGLNGIKGITPTRYQLKHEITELALVDLPNELKSISITVMDGPFFSIMPFPSRQLSTFSHVRYTPHTAWIETLEERLNPYDVLYEHKPETGFKFMVRDAQRYIPCLEDAEHRDSLFEVKTVLVKNEVNDGRPILFEADPNQPRIVSTLGAKIDNIYDVLTAVDDQLCVEQSH